MAEAMIVRANLVGDVAEIRVKMSHPMKVGDPPGNLSTAHFIKTCTISLNGKVVLEGHLNTAVSRNPVIWAKAKGAKKGDKVTVNWVDNKGDKRTDEATVTSGP